MNKLIPEYDKCKITLWNNEKLVNIRENLINNIYPDENCQKCYLYKNQDSYYNNL